MSYTQYTNNKRVKRQKIVSNQGNNKQTRTEKKLVKVTTKRLSGCQTHKWAVSEEINWDTALSTFTKEYNNKQPVITHQLTKATAVGVTKYQTKIKDMPKKF